MANDWIRSLQDDSVPRWQPLVQLAAAWLDGIGPDDGASIEAIMSAEARLGFPLPAALSELYLLVGKRDDLFREQNRLKPPHELEVKGDHLVIWAENQLVVEWGIPCSELQRDDPPVDMIGLGEPQRCNERLSQFAMQMLLMDLFALADHGALAFLPREVSEELGRLYPKLPLPDWPWPLHPTRFFADPRTLLVIDGEGSLYGSSRTRSAHDRLVSFLEGHGVDLDMEWTE